MVRATWQDEIILRSRQSLVDNKTEKYFFTTVYEVLRNMLYVKFTKSHNFSSYGNRKQLRILGHLVGDDRNLAPPIETLIWVWYLVVYQHSSSVLHPSRLLCTLRENWKQFWNLTSAFSNPTRASYKCFIGIFSLSQTGCVMFSKVDQT